MNNPSPFNTISDPAHDRSDRNMTHGAAAQETRASGPLIIGGAANGTFPCPCCGQSTIRIWRRPVDRLVSSFAPLSRRRCESHDCRWEGNIRLRRSVGRGTPGSRDGSADEKDPPRFVVRIGLVVFGVIFVLVATMSAWWPAPDKANTDAAREYGSVFNKRPGEANRLHVGDTAWVPRNDR